MNSIHKEVWRISGLLAYTFYASIASAVLAPWGFVNFSGFMRYVFVAALLVVCLGCWAWLIRDSWLVLKQIHPAVAEKSQETAKVITLGFVVATGLLGLNYWFFVVVQGLFAELLCIILLAGSLSAGHYLFKRIVNIWQSDRPQIL